MKSSCGESPSVTSSIKSSSSPERSTDGESSALLSPIKSEKFVASTFCPVELASPVNDSIPFANLLKVENPLHYFVKEEILGTSENQENEIDDAATEREDEPPQKKVCVDLCLCRRLTSSISESSGRRCLVQQL